MKGRGVIDAVQGARFSGANQGTEVAVIRYILPVVGVQSVEVSEAQHIEGHQILVPSVPQ